MWPHWKGRGMPRSQRWSCGRGGAGSAARGGAATPRTAAHDAARTPRPVRRTQRGGAGKRRSGGRGTDEPMPAADRAEDAALAADLDRGAAEVFARELGDDPRAFAARVGDRLPGFDQAHRGDPAGAEGAVGVERRRGGPPRRRAPRRCRSCGSRRSCRGCRRSAGRGRSPSRAGRAGPSRAPGRRRRAPPSWRTPRGSPRSSPR